MSVLENIKDDVKTYVTAIGDELRKAGDDLRSLPKEYRKVQQQGYSIGLAQQMDDQDMNNSGETTAETIRDTSYNQEPTTDDGLSTDQRTTDTTKKQHNTDVSGPESYGMEPGNPPKTDNRSVDQQETDTESFDYETHETSSSGEYDHDIEPGIANGQQGPDAWTMDTEHAPEGTEADTVGAGESLVTHLRREYGQEDGPTGPLPSQQYVEGLIEKGYENGVIDGTERDRLEEDINDVYSDDTSLDAQEELIDGLETIVSYAKDDRGYEV